MPVDTTLPFHFPAVGRKKLTAAFDGGRITSDGGVMLLGAVERQLGIADRLARLIPDPRNPLFVTHSDRPSVVSRDTAHRQDKTAPIMAELKQRLEGEVAGLSSKSPLAKAIRYTLAHWVGLTRFLQDGRLEPDTNTVERTMRPIALGRRNYLYAGEDGGAETWAILASLLMTVDAGVKLPKTAV